MDYDPIMILTSRSPYSYLLINYLAQRFRIGQIVYEQRNIRKLLRYRVRKLGYRTVFGQLVFSMWDRLVIQPRSYSQIENLLQDFDTNPPDSIPAMDVQSVNSREVQDLFKRLKPKVVVVCGTNIIRSHILELAPIFINIHAGITPRYRGVHGAFWAIIEGNLDLAGTTVHLVDAGVDTGKIINQACIEIDPHQDTFRTLPVKQLIVGLPLIERAISDSFSNSLSTFERNDLESRQWYSPTPGDYFKFIGRLRHLKR
jgi:folate-dependent phosphoribosylglycinamide formyltransferase PurN